MQLIDDSDGDAFEKMYKKINPNFDRMLTKNHRLIDFQLNMQLLYECLPHLK